MTNRELQQILQSYPDDMKVKIFKGYKSELRGTVTIFVERINDFDEENITDFSEKDHYDEETDVYTKGPGERFIYINPPIQ